MPTYAEERDRISADESYWLTPLMRDAFSHRMSEWHEPYSDDKKLFIDCLMRWQYIRECPTKEETLKLTDILQKQFVHKSAALILAPEWLIKIFVAAGIRIKYTIDGEGSLSSGLKQKFKRRIKYRYKKFRYSGMIPTLSMNDELPSVDMIIVADYINYTKWSRRVVDKGAKCTNILELVV